MNSNWRCRLFSLKKHCFTLAIAGTMLSYLMYLSDHIYTSRMGIIAVMTVSFVGCIFSALEYNKIRFSTSLQMFWLYFVFTLLWDVAALSSFSTKTYPFVIILGLVTLNLSTIFWFFVTINKKDILSFIYLFFIKNKFIFLLITIFILLSLEVIDDWLRIDSFSYYQYIRNAKAWDFTFETFRLLQYCAHNTFGYSLFSLIGEYILPGNGYGVRIVQIIMAVLMLGAFSNIIKELKLDHGCPKENALITSILGFIPLILGLLFEVALDFPTACFFVWFIYSYVNHKKIFEIASIFLLIFSKETGILLLFGFAMGWFIHNIIASRKSFRNLFQKNNDFWRYIFIFLIPACFYVLVFFMSDRWSQEENSMAISLNGSQLYKFGVNWDNIVVKFKEFFSLNFSWLILIITIVGSILFLKKIVYQRKLIENLVKKPVWLPLICSGIVFFLFNIFYITYCNPRYITAIYPIYIIFMACAVTNIKKKIQRFIIYLIISILMLIQNFITIDPITLKSFKNLSIGNGTIITTRTFGREANGDLTTDETIWSENEMTHAASYNRQYTYFGDLFEKFLRQIEYTDTTLIAVAPTYGEYMTKLALFGKWDPQAQYFYDPMSGHLVLDETKTLLNLQVIENSSQIDFDSYEEVYLVYFPFREQYYKIDSLISEFEVLDTISTNYRQWKMYGYKLK